MFSCLVQELPDVRALQVHAGQLQVDGDALERKKKYKAAEVQTTKQEITAAQVRALGVQGALSLAPIGLKWVGLVRNT
jgi:hypothetical protein